MTRNSLGFAFAVGVASCLVGCVAVPIGEPRYEPPLVVEEPPAYRWGWTPVPHYEVEHHYVIENEHIVIHDRHYSPFHRKTRPYIRNNKGNHKGWYKHDD